MGKKKSDPLGIIGGVVVAVVVLIAAMPKEVWIVLGLCVAAYVAYKVYHAFTANEPANPIAESPVPMRPTGAGENLARETGYRIPERPRSLAVDARWIPPES
ncbi:MAG: hypothetical protein IPP88_02615 [Betaproteobacteria bacterium]|nr:hypothetical protein [Betaproteobacteria bacterium]